MGVIVKKSPEKIYLVIGELSDCEDAVNFNELHGVSWSDERIYQDDIEYIRNDTPKPKISQEEGWNNSESNCKTFIYDEGQEKLHFIKTGFKNDEYFVIYEDSWHTVNFQTLTKEQIFERFKIELCFI